MIKLFIKNLFPGAAWLNAKVREARASRAESVRRRKFGEYPEVVDEVVNKIRSIPKDKLTDESFLEQFIQEEIGLNDEQLHEQPRELQEFFGRGLHLWQNPKQFSKYLAWLSKNTGFLDSYLEIGCRWGGTFIVVCEVLRLANPEMKRAAAADLITATPFIKRYQELSASENFDVQYFQGSSASPAFESFVETFDPKMTFIDGDHSYLGAMRDHMLVRSKSKVVVHHDVASDQCLETTQLWSDLVALEEGRSHRTFDEQYESVPGSFMGIGVLFH